MQSLPPMSERQLSDALLHVARLGLPGNEYSWTTALQNRLWAGLGEAAAHHKLQPLLASVVADRAVADVLSHRRLVSQVDSLVARQLGATADLDWLTVVLRDACGEWAVLKGPALASLAYPRPELRPYGDLDILVPPEAVETAVQRLEDAGAHLLDRNWRLLTRERRGQLHFALPHGTLLDLHWHLVNRGVARERFRFDTATMLSRTVTFRLGPLALRALDTTDTVIHLAVHAGLGGGERLGWLVDIDRVVAQGGIDWLEVVQRCRAARCARMCGVMLDRCSRLIGTPVPPWVPRELAGTAALRTTRIAERLAPIAGRQRFLNVAAILTAGLTDGRPGFRLPPRARRWIRLPPVRRLRVKGRARGGRPVPPEFVPSGGFRERSEFLFAIKRDTFSRETAT